MNKKKKPQPRLVLSRETMRQLNQRELNAVNGALGSYRSCNLPYTDCPLCDPGP